MRAPINTTCACARLDEFRASVEGLKRMIVSSSKIGWVSLDNLVRVEEGTGPSAIDRLNRQRQVMLLANVKPGGSQAAVIQKMEQFAKEMNIDPRVSDRAGRPFERTGPRRLLLHARVRAVVRLHVHGAGGAV